METDKPKQGKTQSKDATIKVTRKRGSPKPPKPTKVKGDGLDLQTAIAKEMLRYAPQLKALELSEPQRTPLIFSAIRNVMRDVIPLAKTHEHPNQGFDFRRIDEVCARLQPLLVEHGVICTPEALEEKEIEREVKLPTGETFVQIFTKVKVQWHICSAVDGSTWPWPIILWGEGMSEQHFSTAAAQTMSFKQTLCEVFCIPVFGATDPEEVQGERSQASAAKPQYVVPEATTEPQPGLFDAPDTSHPADEKPKPKRGARRPQEPQTVTVGQAALDQTPSVTIETPITPGFKRILESTMNAKGVSQADLFSHFKVEKWEDLKTSQMDAALAFINAPPKGA